MMFLSDLSAAEKVEYIFTVGRMCQNEAICFLGTDYADYTDKL